MSAVPDRPSVADLTREAHEAVCLLTTLKHGDPDHDRHPDVQGTCDIRHKTIDALAARAEAKSKRADLLERRWQGQHALNEEKCRVFYERAIAAEKRAEEAERLADKREIERGKHEGDKIAESILRHQAEQDRARLQAENDLLRDKWRQMEAYGFDSPGAVFERLKVVEAGRDDLDKRVTELCETIREREAERDEARRRLEEARRALAQIAQPSALDSVPAIQAVARAALRSEEK